MSNFVHLHTHSHYSLLDGLGKIPDLVSRAKELGMEALAITDHGTMYGAIEFYKECLKQEIKPIIGTEMYLSPRGMIDKEPKLDNKPYHLVLLAKNEEGYKNLLKMVTAAHLEGYYYKPRIDKTFLAQHARGLVALSACLDGEIPRLILNNKIEKAIQTIKEYQQIFGRENFFLELQHHPELPEQNKVNQELIKIAPKAQAKLVATNDIHYVYPEDRDAHEVLLAVQTGKDYDDETRLSLKEFNLSIIPSEEIQKNFKDVPEAITNSSQIAEMCNLKIPLGQTVLPKFALPQGQTAKSYLEKLCQEGIKKRFGEIQPEIKKRLNYELAVIEKCHFEDYFLIVQDYVKFAKENKILVGPGRGSAAGSLVSYVLGITDIDPLKYELLFERFLNPERVAPPDIDLDFADDRREEVIQYITQKYGADYVAQIITFGVMKARMAVRDVARALGMSYDDGDRIAKLIPFGLTLDEALNSISELQSIYENEPSFKKLIDMAKRLENVARNAGTHAAGVVISQKPLVGYTPLQHPPRGEANVVTQYSMNYLDDIGLLKIDILGLANLTIIRNALRIIRKIASKEIELEKIPLDDPKTFELLARGETSGVFQLECLSGETMVSNTTIKKLYERRDRKRLQSVYLDEGRVHKNQIINVLKSGEKDLYALVTENNWYIKASKDHYFLTKNGWKKMEDIQIGEEVLIKERVKHLVFNTCQLCKKQIDGQKEGKSKLCYQCSASFYKNPRKKISREKIKKTKIRFYQQGGKPWNYGLTLETNNILKKTGQKISLALTGRSLEDLWGKEKAEEFKKAHSKRNQGSNNPMFGKNPPHRKGGYRSDLSHYVRSSWEADFARILQFHQIDYQYEPRTFRLIKTNGEVLNYTPDFYIPSKNTFYEIKGWLHDLDAEKMKLFQEQYHQTNLVLISATKFAEFALKYKTLIKWECPKIPIKQSFKFIKVKEIKYSGREPAFDIVMKSPGNNFIANGFLVHNSDGMKRYLKELRPTQLEDIISMVALYRPGPIESISDFIAAKNGQKRITYLHPKLEPILKKTYGVIVTQEQVLEIARALAGFTYAEADILRKAVGKKIKKLLDEQKEKFIKGCLKNEIDQRTAQKLWDFIEPFARYGFNRAHAACYALIAYQTAYLKAHYPQAFLAAWLTAEQQNIDKIAFAVNEARRMKIEVLPPDVNESFVEFGVMKESGNIRFGLAAIKNVGVGVSEAITEERKVRGPYLNLEDFLRRLGSQVLNKKVIEALAKSGALDRFAGRNEILAGMENILKFIGLSKIDSKKDQLNLFGTSKIELATLELPQIEEASKKQRLSWEKELLGMYISEHPLKGMEKILESNGSAIINLNENMNGRKTRLAGIITNVKKITTKSREPMIFVTLEDISGKAEVLVFPKIFQKTTMLWQQDNIVSVVGRINTRDGTLKVIAEEIKEIATQTTIVESASLSMEEKIVITLPLNTRKDLLEKIKTILLAFPGQLPVYLKIPQNGTFREIKTKTRVQKDSKMIKQLKDLIGQNNIETTKV